MGVNAFKFSPCNGCAPKHARKCKSKVREAGNEENGVTRGLPNPDPGNFVIELIKEIGDFLLVRVRYPGCVNFEGVKILLYRDVSMAQLASVKRLDPHFADGKVVPIARFIPTVEGLVMGEMFAKMLFNRENTGEVKY